MTKCDDERKLDEASCGHGLPRKTFVRMLRGTTDPFRLLQFRRAADFYDKHRSEIAQLGSDPELSPVVNLLSQEEEWIECHRSDILRRRLGYGWFTFLRNHRSARKKSVFGFFESSGRAFAELKQPGVKPVGAPKWVSDAHREIILRLARPGDIFLIRHEDALNNLFLPGFWPHAAFYLGTESRRRSWASNCCRAQDPVVFLDLSSPRAGIPGRRGLRAGSA